VCCKDAHGWASCGRRAAASCCLEGAVSSAEWLVKVGETGTSAADGKQVGILTSVVEGKLVVLVGLVVLVVLVVLVGLVVLALEAAVGVEVD